MAATRPRATTPVGRFSALGGLTEEFCEGTPMRVVTDPVAVTNFVNHRHLTVTVGHSYLGKAP